MRIRLLCSALLMSFLWSPLLQAQLVLSEVLYDPVGADDGAELIEIKNTGPAESTKTSSAAI